MPSSTKMKAIKKVYQHIKTEKRLANINIESELETKVKNMDFRGLGWKFNRFTSLRVILFKGGIAEKASYVDMPKKQSITIIKNRDTLCGL